MYHEIPIPLSEELVVFFFRTPGVSHEKLFASDFIRRHHVHEGGLSFLRPALLTYKRMVLMTRNRSSKQPRGLAFCSAGQLAAFNLRFFGDSEDPHGYGHICVHCHGCCGSKEDCNCSPDPCPISPVSDAKLREILASEILKIRFAPRPAQDILSALGSDLEGNLAEINQSYYHRWGELTGAGG